MSNAKISEEQVSAILSDIKNALHGIEEEIILNTWGDVMQCISGDIFNTLEYSETTSDVGEDRLYNISCTVLERASNYAYKQLPPNENEYETWNGPNKAFEYLHKYIDNVNVLEFTSSLNDQQREQ